MKSPARIPLLASSGTTTACSSLASGDYLLARRSKPLTSHNSATRSRKRADEPRKAWNSCARRRRRLIDWSGQRLEDKLKQDGFPSFSQGKIGQPLLMWLNFRPGMELPFQQSSKARLSSEAPPPPPSDFTLSASTHQLV